MLLENPLNESVLAFPVLEWVHIFGFTCGVGLAALVDFRLLAAGAGAAKLWRDTWIWSTLGLVTAVFAGLMLFSINPDVYYLNRTFLWKMGFLAAALVVHYTLVRGAARSGRAGRAIASVSLALWMCVVFGGVFIGLSSNRPPASAPAPAQVNFDDFLRPGQ